MLQPIPRSSGDCFLAVSYQITVLEHGAKSVFYRVVVLLVGGENHGRLVNTLKSAYIISGLNDSSNFRFQLVSKFSIWGFFVATPCWFYIVSKADACQMLAKLLSCYCYRLVLGSP